MYPPLGLEKLKSQVNVTFQIRLMYFWWLAWLVDGLEPHLPPLSSQKNEMLIFGLCATSDDRPGWSMDSNPICHPSPAKQMKCSFLDYVQLLMIGRAGWWTQNPSATPLQPKIWNAHFWITFNFWWSAWLVDGLELHLPPFSSQKNEMLIFGLHSTPDDWLGWLMDSKPICHPSPAKKMKCSFLDYIQLLMIGWAGRWTRMPSATPFQPKNEMLIFWLHSTSGDQPSNPSNESQPKCDKRPPKSSKNEILIFINYVQLLMISQAIWVMKVDQNAKKWHVVSARVFCCFS